MSSIMTTASLGDAYIKGMTAKLAGVIDQAAKDYSVAMTDGGLLGVETVKATALVKLETTENRKDSYSGISGLDNLEETADGGDYKLDSFISTYKTVYTYLYDYTKIITETRQMRADQESYKAINKTGKLMTSGKRTMNEHMWDGLNYAFTAPASLPNHLTYYADGVNFCSATHPILGATGTTTTQSNLKTLALNYINLNTVILALKSQAGDKTNKRQSYGSGKIFLVVPIELELTAVTITKSKLRPSTANNDVNVYDGSLVTVVSSPLLTSATAWFVVDANNSPLQFNQREALGLISPYFTDSNGNLTWGIKGRWQMGNIDWRGVVGSNPS